MKFSTAAIAVCAFSAIIAEGALITPPGTPEITRKVIECPGAPKKRALRYDENLPHGHKRLVVSADGVDASVDEEHSTDNSYSRVYRRYTHHVGDEQDPTVISQIARNVARSLGDEFEELINKDARALLLEDEPKKVNVIEEID